MATSRGGGTFYILKVVTLRKVFKVEITEKNMVTTLEKLKYSIDRDNSSRSTISRIWKSIRSKRTAKEKVYDNLSELKQTLEGPDRYVDVSLRQRANMANPVWKYLKEYIDENKYNRDVSEEQELLNKLEKRKLTQEEYRGLVERVVDDINENHVCSIDGRTLGEPMIENDKPKSMFTRTAYVRKGTRLKKGDHWAGGTFLGFLTGHAIIGGLVGASMKNNEVVPYIGIEVPNEVYFGFDGIISNIRATDLVLNGKSLEDGEEVEVDYREVYEPWWADSRVFPPEKDDLISRAKTRRRIELVNLRRKGAPEKKQEIELYKTIRI